MAGECESCRTWVHRTGSDSEYPSRRRCNAPSRPCNNARDDAPLSQKMIEAAATAFASIVVLGTGFGMGGYIYHRFYKWLVLHKMEGAFEPGDPVLDLAAIGKQIPNSITSPPPSRETDEHWILRDEQAKIDAIVNGTHADMEIFRIRLGKALDFEFHEDYIGSYFSERGPRESTALLDIERAFNKLEKVALKRRKTVGKPLVVIINAVHLLRDNEDGRDLLELLQQRAEQWAASNLVTIVFNSDDYWVYERLKQLATRMEVTSITDLPKHQAMAALGKYRRKYFREKPDKTVLEEVYDRVGGRLTFLNRVAKSKDMLKTCDAIIDSEKRWFLNQCWILGMEMDDDRAFREICEEEGFDEHLAKTLQRISDIESLGRTRELVAKDLVRGGTYRMLLKDGERRGEKVTEIVLEMPPEDADGESDGS
ncbi:hypothetical protein BUE80_DR004390 [Diplocarpon rosae]|nr:hypothetical protein BUE80_DR004390 [Diplocarpon rosae]